LRVILTGSDGYLGRVVYDRLTRARHEVYGIDTGYFTMAGGGAQSAARCDIRDLSRSALEGFDAVVHLAGLSNDACADLNPALTRRLNADEPARLAREARHAGVRRFVFASTCSVYGVSGGVPSSELGPVNPVSAYARAKLLGEQGVFREAKASVVPVVLRLATLFGLSPNMRTDLAVNRMTASAVTRGTVTLAGRGVQHRPFLHIQDAARAIEFALGAAAADVGGRCFNVAAANGNLRMSELASLIQQAMPGADIAVDDSPPDTRDYLVDCSRLASLGLSIQSDFSAAIHQIAAYFSRSQKSFRELTAPPSDRAAALRELLDTAQLDSSLRWLSATPHYRDLEVTP
jgi:nucleoside-diphosphate-sugar epimerase